MQFDAPLIEGVLLARYKRFLADVRLADGATVTAHCPNTGAMLGVADPGRRCWVSRSDDPRRKHAHTLQAVEADGTMVGINTGLPNRLAEEAIRAGLFPELGPVDRLAREVRYGRNSRVDILLEATEGPDGPVPRRLVEVKNVHLVRQPGLAEFPDCVTARGAKHLAELADAVAEGAGAAMLYLVQRADADRLALAADLDPAYARAFEEARARGVRALACGCTVTAEGIRVDRRLAILA